MKTPIFDVIVVGGGASGMMAAIQAAKNGAKVLILEHIDVLGKKILATGNGRCNFTNTKQGSQYYRSDTPAFVLPFLNQFSAVDTIAFFEDLGIMTTEKNGYCYPRTMQASAIRNGLLRTIESLKISVLCDVGIRKIEKKNGLFYLDTKTGTFVSKTCILACGGKADPKSGSDGSGFIYAKQIGHSIVEPVPALVPLVSDASWLKEVKGVRQDAKVALFVNDEEVFSDHGEVQFTDYGISGIPVFQISRFASKGILKKANIAVVIDFVPEMDACSLKTWIVSQMKHHGGELESMLSGIVNQKIAIVLARMLPFYNQDFSRLSNKQQGMLIDKTVGFLKETRISIIDTKTFAQAQVTAGGISTKEVDSQTLESKIVQGLFFVGEMLDVDGMCGGYNLQWAWSSGYVAGKEASRLEK